VKLGFAVGRHKKILDAFAGSLLVSLLAANGARYRMLFLRLLGVCLQIKTPLAAGAYGM